MVNTLTMPRKGLYAITDDQLLSQDNYLSYIEKSLIHGVKILQYRDKHRAPQQRQQQAMALKNLCHQYDVPLLINDDLQLAKQIGADGVHLGKHDASLQQARDLLGDNAIIGVSCYQDVNTALAMQQQGADYVAFGRFFPSQTKPNAPAAPIDLLSQVKSQLNIPIVAIGGISVDNGGQLLNAGADMLAVIHDLFGQLEHIPTKAQRYAELFV